MHLLLFRKNRKAAEQKKSRLFVNQKNRITESYSAPRLLIPPTLSKGLYALLSSRLYCRFRNSSQILLLSGHRISRLHGLRTLPPVGTLTPPRRLSLIQDTRKLLSCFLQFHGISYHYILMISIPFLAELIHFFTVVFLDRKKKTC